jgi:SAM-dependent methyltransferase
MKSEHILALGAGRRERASNVVRVDLSAEVDPDLVWNLDVYPYPFEANHFTDVEMFDVIEHLENIPATLEEIHRVSQPGAIIRITTPHFSCANSFTDPTHKHHFGYFSFDYFLAEHQLAYYSKARFSVRSRSIEFQGGRISRSIVRRLANRFPKAYEQRWAWIFPAWFLSFELTVVK